MLLIIREQQHARERRDQNEHLGVGDLNKAVAQMKPQHAIQHRRHALLAWPLTELGVVLQNKGHPDGGDQRREARGVAQRPVGYPLDGPAVHAGDNDGEGQRAEDQQRERLQTEERQQREADGAQVSRDHIDFAVREINHADDAINHGIADGDESVDGTEG